MGRLKRAIIILLTIVCALFIAGALVFIPAYADAKNRLSNLPGLVEGLQKEPTNIVSADGKLLYSVSGEYRDYVYYRDIPKVVIDATVAAEDVRFWQHDGVDLRSLGRVFLEAARDKRFSQGGSTLTMQLSKRLYSEGEQTYQRKVQDIATAVAMERELTKQQVIELYLNQVFFGSGAFGIKAAAHVYFNKPLDRLTLSEAAMLIRCVRRPTTENPFKDYDKALENRDVVLGIMLDEGMIDKPTYEKAKAQRPKLNPHPPKDRARKQFAPYFVDHVLAEIRRDFPHIDISEGGYKIFTTLDANLQSVAEDRVRKVVSEYKRQGVTTGAFILMDYKGRILAEVGGVDYDRNQYNVITQGKRQPGSSFKPFVYSTAFAQGTLHPDDYISNAPFYYRDPWSGSVWAPKNSSNRFPGTLSVETAFKWSVNIPAVRVIEKVGPATVGDYAKNVFGFSNHFTPYLSMALGAQEVSPLEMAQAYSVFMTGGDRVKPMAIVRIVGPDGKVIQSYNPTITPNVLNPSVVKDMDHLMRAVVESGTGTRASVVPNAHGKTGTTSENKDAWFCGYTDGLVGIGWIANEKRVNGHPVYDKMSSTTFGGTVTVQIWAGIMKEAHKRYAVKIDEKKDWSIPFAEDQAEVKGASAREAEDKAKTDTTTPTTTTPPVEPLPGTTQPDPTDVEPVPGQQPPNKTNTVEPPPDEPVSEVRDKTPPKPKPKPQPPPIEFVDVEICADSRMKASMYCNETVVRTYRKGQEPTKVCTQHGPRQ